MPVREAQRTRGLDWLTSALLLAGVGASAASFSGILSDVQWWFVLMAMAALVLGAAAGVRSFARHRAWGSLGAVVATIGGITLFFAPGTALLGVIPTFETFDALRILERAGVSSIATQGLPANADAGIVYLLTLGVAAFCVLADAAALSLRVPAFAGVPLLALLLVPSIVDPGIDDGLFFVLTAAAYVGLLLVRSRPAGRAAGAGLAAVAVVAALVIPLALPPVVAPDSVSSGSGGPATGLNPIITLGNDLRQGEPSLVLTYRTTEPDGVYLRTTSLDDFTGTSWGPSNIDPIPANTVDEFGPAMGLEDDVPRTPATTQITVGNIASRWLPVPYAATSITGLEGTWRWEPEALVVRSTDANIRNQDYEVQSVSIAPSVEQLLAAGTTVEPGFERYLALPDDLPPVVASTALDVVGDAATNYEKALALQAYFRGGQFTYSEDAPVENGYDGSGASVLEPFLAAKSGYCVHFASAMAAMGRTLDIPSRVVVGFTPGEATLVDGGTEYRVTTRNFHTWPEFYFVGIGWVRFEPTPGRGNPPSFAPLSVDDPSTPDVDESVPTPAATDAPMPTSAPSVAPDSEPAPSSTAQAVPDAPSRSIPWGWGVLAAATALLFAPALLRAIRRARRTTLAVRGAAAPAWDELRDTADDLGLGGALTRTPRQLADDLAQHLDARGTAALARLRAALETEAFHERASGIDADDLGVVIRSLRRRAGPARAVVSVLAPRSLFARWLPQPG